MILPIVKYGHPVLRQRGAKIPAMTLEIRALAADMIETMHAANGVGLAAQQVGKALMLLVADVGDSERPSTLEIDGKPVNVHDHMPMVLINQVITEPTGDVLGNEGCLSFPGISADIRRAEAITVTAMGLNGKTTTFRCSGLLARVIQHEGDHLNGVLFIDRMDSATKVSLGGQLKRLARETEEALKAARKSSKSRNLVAARP
ncbi:MAG: peptide deformylase [Verrucomicrobia bacterium]|nr:peptide deformylase [Verrucomicrobiota bacterium]